MSTIRIPWHEAPAQPLRRYARREHRPVSHVVEITFEGLLKQRAPATEHIVTSSARCDGRFSREETCGERCAAVQNLAETYRNLPRPRRKPPGRPAVARAKILAVASLPTLQVLPLTGDVQDIALELCEKHSITRQHYVDAQLVATRMVHGIRTLLTENDADFKDMSEIPVVSPLA